VHFSDRIALNHLDCHVLAASISPGVSSEQIDASGGECQYK
jgi:hypothetical protein